MLLSFSFNGMKKPFIIMGKNKRRSAFAPITRNLLSIQGMEGAYLSSTDTQVRIIQQPIVIKANDKANLRKLEEELAAWLLTDTPKELIFDDEPDRVYFAVVDGNLDIEDIVHIGVGTIKFICLDPYKYGTEKNIENSSGTIIVDNTGTVDTPPVITMNIKKATTHLDIVKSDAYMRLGRIPSAEEIIYEPVTTLLSDSFSSAVGWTKTSFTTDIGVIAADGAIISDGADFLPQSYGTGSLWYGPAVAKSLSSTVSNYLFRFRIRHDILTLAEMGRTSLFLLDASNKPVARLTLVKDTAGQVSTPEIRLFGLNGETNYILRMTRDQVEHWKDAYVFLELKKEGNTFVARVARTRGEGGRVEEEHSVPFTDTQGIFTRNIASVAINFMKYSNSPSLNRNRGQELLGQRINPNTGIPNILQAGDIVELDHKTNDIRINGETRLIKTFGSSFFKLNPGQNIILVSPSDVADTKITWRERYK